MFDLSQTVLVGFVSAVVNSELLPPSKQHAFASKLQGQKKKKKSDNLDPFCDPPLPPLHPWILHLTKAHQNRPVHNYVLPPFLSTQVELFLLLPLLCTHCSAQFEGTSTEASKTWKLIPKDLRKTMMVRSHFSFHTNCTHFHIDPAPPLMS